MKLMILDGNSIVNRAFYGVRPLNAPDGTPTNAVYGFLAIFQRLMDEETPDSVCVAFDLKAPTFRHDMFDGYKAQRKPMPEELAVQMPILKSVLDAMGVKRLECQGWEADDILGTVSVKCERAGWDCVIVTGDKDSFQLITDAVHVRHVKSRMGQQETVEYDPAVFRGEYGFEPALMVDLKALMGDASDNIPGVPGVGEKTALELIRRFGAVEGIYSALPDLDIKDGVRKKLADGEESARLSYTLAAIRTDAPVELEPEAAKWTLRPTPELYELLRRLGFSRFIEKWGLAPGADPEPERVYEGECSSSEIRDPAQLARALTALGDATAYIYCGDSLDYIVFLNGCSAWVLDRDVYAGDYRAALTELFRPSRPKAGHNVKDIQRMLLDGGVDSGVWRFDTAVAAYLLDPTASSYELGSICPKYAGFALDDRREEAQMSLLPEANRMAEYLQKASVVELLTEKLSQRLRDNGMEELLTEMELPLCQVLAEMEHTGFLVDREALAEFGDSLSSGIDALQKRIWELAGGEFNINSPKQLGEVLFDRLLLPAGKKTKTGWSTGAEVLDRLRGKHPIIGAVLEYRELTKLKSTYADGLIKVISSDGRIHTNFKMTVTATGRLSSTEPNLQNIPVRKELGSEIRKMFVAAPGKVLVDADYSQIELRILAHISGDETMRRAFLSGEDIHTVTASQVFGVPPEQVTPIQRSRAKAVNFGIVYGISAFSLAQDIDVRPGEAREYIDAYLAKYHGVREYMERVIAEAKEKGYAETMYHRRRPLPELRSTNFNTRSFGERVARNMPIQGAAADIIKLAMAAVSRRMKAEGLAARLILQVHDELIVECPAAEAERVELILDQEMEGAAKLSVPLTAQAKSGRTWAEAH